VGFDLLQVVVTTLPPSPRGWSEGRPFCDRRGQRIERNDQYDAAYSPRCPRWVGPLVEFGQRNRRAAAKRPAGPTPLPSLCSAAAGFHGGRFGVQGHTSKKPLE